MSLLPVLLLPGSRRRAYRGADRRGILVRLSEPAVLRFAVGVLAVMVGVPVAGLTAIRLLPGLVGAATSSGAADVAMVAFVAAGALALLRWRMVGEAAGALIGVAAVVAGMLVVPAIPVTHPLPGYVAALQATAVAVMLALLAGSLRVPAVCSGLRPALLAASAAGLALAAAAPLTFLIIDARHQGAAMAAIRATEALACIAVAVPLLGRGISTGRLLFVGAGGALIAIAAACVTVSVGWLTAGGAPPDPPSFVLVAGAGQLLLLAAVEVRTALGAVVLPEVRGRRRWVAAESELARLQRAERGQRHDLASLLSAIDGTLMVLAERQALPVEERDRLVRAVRSQLQGLMSALGQEGREARGYDLSQLLGELASVHAAPLPRLRAAIEPGLVAHGHPDRVAMVVTDLLANVAAHADGAEATLIARCLSGEGGESVEIAVADSGPGIADADLTRACEPGWRGDGARRTPGRGLGLFQCRQLVGAEGGELLLTPTHGLGAVGARGLTVRVRLPLRPVALSSPILQMRFAPDGAIPEGVVPVHPGPGRAREP